MIKKLDEINFDGDFQWVVAQIKDGEQEDIEKRFNSLEYYERYKDDIECFAYPEFIETKFTREKRITEVVPLFDTYLFIKIRKSSLVWMTLEKEEFSLFKFLCYRDGDNIRKLHSVKEEEVQALIKNLNDVKDIEIGSRVRITSDVCKDLVGRVASIKGVTAKVVLDEIIKRVEINVSCIELHGK